MRHLDQHLHIVASHDAPPDAETLAVAILRGDHDHHLHALDHAVHQRQRLLEDQQAAIRLAQLRPGQHVQLNTDVRPKYLIGAHGTVIDTNDRTVTVLLDHPIGRYGPTLRCPPTTIDPVINLSDPAE